MSRLRRIVSSLLLATLIICNGICQTIKFKTTKAIFSEDEIRKVLSIYPKELLNNYLKEIVIEEGEGFRGRAEVFSNRVIINASCQELEEVFHHEISSLFLHLYDGGGKPTYDASVLDSLYGAFLALNGDYKYSYSNDIYSTQLIDPNLSDRFYIFKYASRDFENDWNVISASLFIDGRQVINFIEAHPDKPVSKKIEMVIAFYNRINPAFTKDFFRTRL